MCWLASRLERELGSGVVVCGQNRRGGGYDYRGCPAHELRVTP